MSQQVQSKSQLLYAAEVAIHEKDQQIKDLRARLAAVEAERDRLRDGLLRAAKHNRSYAAYLRDFHWEAMAEEFDDVFVVINAALAAPADDAGEVKP